MSIRGQIVIECDERRCHAEVVIDADEFNLAQAKQGMDITLEAFAFGWAIDSDDRFICPQCIEEDEQRSDAHERAAARARNNDFAETGGKDWT